MIDCRVVLWEHHCADFEVTFEIYAACLINAACSFVVLHVHVFKNSPQYCLATRDMYIPLFRLCISITFLHFLCMYTNLCIFPLIHMYIEYSYFGLDVQIITILLYYLFGCVEIVTIAGRVKLHFLPDPFGCVFHLQNVS